MLYDLKTIKQLTNIDSISLTNHIREANKYRLLTNDEEIELARKIKDENCQKSIDKMVKHNLRFAISVAKQYSGSRYDLDELVNVANIGLFEAAKKFDYTKGFKFISYAVWHLKNEILTHITNDYIVKPSQGTVNTMVKVNRYINNFLNDNEYHPDIKDVAKEFNISEDILTPTMSLYNNHVTYLDVKHDDFEDSESARLKCDNDTLSPDYYLEKEHEYSQLNSLLNKLSLRQKEIIKHYFGLDGCTEKTIYSIEDEIGVSRETIRTELYKALRIMRYAKYNK